MTVRGQSLVVAVILLLAACGGVQPPAEQGEGLANGSFTAELNGFSIHYEVHGQGPVLMTLPNSWGLSLHGLRNLYRQLEQHFTMVYFDPRGMGSSDPIRVDEDMSMAAVRADFDALRQQLGLDRVNAIGWSNGCTNLVFHASEYPETLDAAIFLHGVASFSEQDMAAFVEEHPELMAMYMKYQQEVAANEALSVEEKTAEMRRLWMEDYFPLLFADPSTAPAHLDVIFGDAEFNAAHADYSNSELGNVFDITDRLSRITARSLVIAGAHDASPPDKVREIADGIPGARFLLLEGSGHFSPVEEPEVFVKAVTSFVSGG
jgi:proline iminopeptidase